MSVLHNVNNSETFARQQAMREQRGNRLIEKYGKDKRLDGWGERLFTIANKNPKKAQLIALKLEQQEAINRKILSEGLLTETTFSNTFGVTPESTLKVTLIGAALSNRPNWMQEVQLGSMDDVYYYIDKVRDTSVRGATAGEKLLEVENYRYSTEVNQETAGTGNDATTNFTGTTAALGVTYTVKIITRVIATGRQDVVATFDENGNKVGSALSAGTYDYSTGDFDITFAIAPATGVTIYIEYNYNSEDPANYNSNIARVSLVTRKVNFRPRPKTIGVEYTDMSVLKYNNAFDGRSLEDDLVKAMAEEMAAARDYEGINEYVRIANKNAEVNFDAKFATYGEMSDSLHAQKAWDAIELAEKTVNNEQKRGGDFSVLIAGSKAGIYLRKVNGFDRSGAQKPTAGSWYTGKFGNRELYETVSSSTRLAEDQILLVNYNPDETSEPVAVAGVIAELDSSLRYPDFSTQANVARVEDIVEVNSKNIRKMTIENVDWSLAASA